MRKTCAGLAISVALGVAGCGGDDDAAESPSPVEPAATTQEAAPATTEELVAAAAGVTPEEVTCATATAGDETSETTTTPTTTTPTTTTTTTATTESESITCQADEREFVVADSESPLELDTLTAELTEVQASEEASGDYLEPRPAKNGVFLIATLTVSNNDFAPQKFDDLGDQVLLKVGQATYKEPFNVLNGVLTDSFLWKDQNIRPNTSAFGDVAFDIPDLAVEEMNTEGDGALLVLNFGDAGNARGADQVGLLRIGEIAAPESTEESTTTTTTGESETFTGTTTTGTTTTTTSETAP